MVRRRDGRGQLRYGELAQDASTQPVPADVSLKPARQFTRVGRPTRRVDGEAKVRGTAVFSLDQRRPKLLRQLSARLCDLYPIPIRCAFLTWTI